MINRTGLCVMNCVVIAVASSAIGRAQPVHVPAAPAESAEPVPAEEMKLCCECICVPHYPDPWCFLGDCVWVPADEPCPEPYIDPDDCPADDEDGDSGGTVPPDLQIGDLLFVEGAWWVPGASGWDHVAMYIGENRFIEAADYPGTRVVTITPLAFYYLWADEIAYGTVTTASAEQRLAAVDFAWSQLYSPYQDPYECWWASPDPNDPDDPYSGQWYCAELVWAAYYNQGIDIDAHPGPEPPEEGGDGVHLWVSPQDIADDDDVEVYPNGAPAVPATPSGPTTVRRLETRLYATSAVDPENDRVYYQWDWGESLGVWDVLPRASGATVWQPHTWLTLGVHPVRVRAKDVWGHVGPWSDVLWVTVTSWFEGDLGLPGGSGSTSGDLDGYWLP